MDNDNIYIPKNKYTKDYKKIKDDINPNTYIISEIYINSNNNPSCYITINNYGDTLEYPYDGIIEKYICEVPKGWVWGENTFNTWEQQYRYQHYRNIELYKIKNFEYIGFMLPDFIIDKIKNYKLLENNELSKEQLYNFLSVCKISAEYHFKYLYEEYSFENNKSMIDYYKLKYRKSEEDILKYKNLSLVKNNDMILDNVLYIINFEICIICIEILYIILYNTLSYSLVIYNNVTE